MNNIEAKKQEVIEELEKWFARPDCRQFYYDEPLETISRNLSETNLKKSTWLCFDQLENWHSNNFVYKGLKENDISDQLSATTNGYFVLEITSIFAKQYPNNPPNLGFHKTANYLANVIIHKWTVESKNMLEWILEGIETKFLKGGQKFELAAWFIVSVTCNAFNKKLEKEKYNYPNDMNIYQQVIDEWDTPDTIEVDKMVSRLCDYHLNQADFEEDKIYLFSFINEFIYLYEILSWLSLRELNGLKNPESYTHPLMQLSINQLPKIITTYQTTELYDKVLNKLKEI